MPIASAFSAARAELLASRLEIGLDVPVCYACLGEVACALDYDGPVAALRQARQMTPFMG